MLDEKAIIFKVQYLYGKHGRRCGRYKREGECALPGEVCLLRQKSADGIVLSNLCVKTSCTGRPEHEVRSGASNFDGEEDTNNKD